MEPEWAPSPPGKAGYWAIPNPTRSDLIDLFERGNVQVVFAGHWHRNNYARNGKMEMITSGPVGYPLGEDPSGYRLVKIDNTQISHSYHKLNQ
jgi:predicted phosphodiesterase